MADVATADVAAEVSTTIEALRTEVWNCLVDLDNMSKYFLRCPRGYRLGRRPPDHLVR